MSTDRARRILLEAFWTSEGWRRAPAVAPDEFDMAKAEGVMFDPSQSTHADAVRHAVEAAAVFTPHEISRAFVASLIRRRPEYRSAMGSFALARLLPEHEPMRPPGHGLWCGICGELIGDDHIDWNVLNFERVKWGGVRHGRPSYAAFDLTLFRRLPEITPSREDWELLRSILHVAATQPAEARPADLERALGKVLKSNKAERQILLQILGYAGILQSRAIPALLQRFTPAVEQVTETEWSFPMSGWRGSDGVQMDAVAFWFPELEVADQ
jgi:hypothetical protein